MSLSEKVFGDQCYGTTAIERPTYTQWPLMSSQNEKQVNEKNHSQK